MTSPKRTERVTLKDVARVAGVSDISVSRVMRRAPNISDGLRDKVIQAANDLGYTPNRLAGALKTANSNLVAVVVPSMSNEVFPEVLDGIDSVLSANGLSAVLGISKYDPDREVEAVRELLAWSPMGLILTGLNASAAVTRMVEAQGIPVVQIMDTDGTAIQSAVGISHSAAGAAAADFLLDRGYGAPGYVGAWGERPARSRIRREAFAARLAERGAPLQGYKILPGQSSAPLGAEALASLLSEHPGLDSVFFANDDLAVGALFHCMANGIRVPQDLALLGFNGIAIGSATPTKLTSISTQRFRMGVEAAKLLIDNDPDSPKTVDLGFSFTDGASV
ncbi:LacI family transcriptional regulator [Jannaschia pagri]|uniref:LacI family transcriptional regulator n=1 Tax=Jannaschia pagri TaxID=2829797 RepID=A0ABQ4NIN6_9RHOB|nr:MULTISPECIES: LacI family DNA-binding transcriptional regulator [unclassified Jannaschia]GIT89610.1 LacI family transcriptional regulator [Jannaschia sp. AI_61]GIT94282.1 LacI family transcriptional regulator [Jannaschia sp. AI_62]